MELPLSTDLRKEILGFYKKSKDKREANYLNIILLKDDGYTQKEIASILRLDEDTICTWVKKFGEMSDLNSYLKNEYTGYIGKLSYTLVGKINNYVKNRICSDSKSILSYVKAKLGVTYSLSGINKLLHRIGFRHKQLVKIPSGLDIVKQEKFIEQYESIKSNLSPTSAMFFVDAVHPQHNTHASKAWLKVGKPTYILTNNGRKRLNINGLYNPINKDVIVTYHQTINAQATIETLEKVKKEYAGYDELFIFADNARYYVSVLLKEYLAQNPIFKLIHLPPYSPNLNLIERLWKFTRKKVINTIFYEKFNQFSESIVDFFDHIYDFEDELDSFIGTKLHLFNIKENPKTSFA